MVASAISAWMCVSTGKCKTCCKALWVVRRLQESYKNVSLVAITRHAERHRQSRNLGSFGILTTHEVSAFGRCSTSFAFSLGHLRKVEHPCSRSIKECVAPSLDLDDHTIIRSFVWTERTWGMISFFFFFTTSFMLAGDSLLPFSAQEIYLDIQVKQRLTDE